MKIKQIFVKMIKSYKIFCKVIIKSKIIKSKIKIIREIIKFIKILINRLNKIISHVIFSLLH